MGAWGVNTFENDDSLDWIGDFCDESNEEALNDAFTFVNEIGDNYLEAIEASSALAAAEIVAALKHSPSPDLPEDVKECVNNLNLKPSDKLISDSLRAIERVKSDSELKELWEESERFSEWNKVVDNLINRLKT